ncbi:hypothetical protein KBC03_00950 [Patescibacteria group bacterium]|nr:hypothetical protein [Patescibacteria group bacterium]
MLLEDYGISVDPAKHFFASTSKQVYLVSPHYMSIHELLYVEKIGVPVLKRHNDTELHPLHGLGTMLGSLANKNTIQLTAKECQRYSDGYDLDTDATITTKNKYAILKRERYGFSVGKVV